MKTAKCLVDIEHNLDWLTAGDFSFAFESLHSPARASERAKIETLKAELAQRNDDIAILNKTTKKHTYAQQIDEATKTLTSLSPEYFKLENDHNELKKTLFTVQQSSQHLTAENAALQAQLEMPKIVVTIISSDVYEQVRAILFHQMNDCCTPATIAYSSVRT